MENDVSFCIFHCLQHSIKVKKRHRKNCSSNRKGLLSVNCRRQALSLCLDPAIVVVIQIFNELLLKVFHRVKFLQIQQLTRAGVRI